MIAEVKNGKDRLINIAEVEKEKLSLKNRYTDLESDDEEEDGEDEDEEWRDQVFRDFCTRLFHEPITVQDEFGEPVIEEGFDEYETSEEVFVNEEVSFVNEKEASVARNPQAMMDEEEFVIGDPPGIVKFCDNWMQTETNVKDEKQKVIDELDAWGKEEEDDEDKIVIAEVFEINGVESEKKWVKIAIDSAAAESVCPPGWAEEFKVTPCVPGQEQSFVNASGGPIKHYGEKRVALLTPGGDRVIGMPFQACDVKRPLAAVRRICEKGNIVQFGPSSDDNFIMNVMSREKIWLQQERGQYIMEASLESGSTF